MNLRTILEPITSQYVFQLVVILTFFGTASYWLLVFSYSLFERIFLKLALPHRLQSSNKNKNAPSTTTLTLLVLFNQLILSGVMTVSISPFFFYRGVEVSWETLPPWYIFIFQALGTVLVHDTCFYWGHRLLHIRFLFRTVHKLHHKIRTPYPSTGSFVHPIEYLLTYMAPFGLIGLCFGFHAISICLGIILINIHNVHDHCGYSYPLDPVGILSTNKARHHDAHHLFVNYNFCGGYFDFWDIVCKTHYQAPNRNA